MAHDIEKGPPTDGLTRAGGWAGLLCAATYIFGFALMLTVFAPLGFGTQAIDPAAVVAFIDQRSGVMILWNSTIYILNALALIVLVMALATRIAESWPGCAAVSRGIGIIWCALVLGAGMLANVAVEQVLQRYPSDPNAAAEVWSLLHAVELGLGGGNEIAGGVWIGMVSLAAWRLRVLPRWVAGLGILTGGAGALTLIPTLGDSAGAVFGLGGIAWFAAVGVALLRSAKRG